MSVSKIKIAFLKYGGLSAGGTEKYLQTLAAHLPKEDFEIDYYYTDATKLIGTPWVHPDTDEFRRQYMIDNKINLIKVSCEARDYRFGPPYDWINTNFFEIFDENKYDFLQTGRSGFREYPFYKLDKIKIVDSIHSQGAEGTYDKENIVKTVLISELQFKNWTKNGGNSSKVQVIPTLVETPSHPPSSLRTKLNIPEKALVFGMHQGNRTDIFSRIPLDSYNRFRESLSSEDSKNVFYILLGGTHLHREQAVKLNLKNIIFLDFNADVSYIHDFISSIDVFAHGRADGEVCSAAIIEALSQGKPVVTHPAQNNGHLEQIDGCGVVANSAEEYAEALRNLFHNHAFRRELSLRAKNKYTTAYSLDTCVEAYINIYKKLYDNLP